MILATIAVVPSSPPRQRAKWRPYQSCGYVMTVKVGLKRMEFEKSKANIAVDR